MKLSKQSWMKLIRLGIILTAGAVELSFILAGICIGQDHWMFNTCIGQHYWASAIIYVILGAYNFAVLLLLLKDWYEEKRI